MGAVGLVLEALHTMASLLWHTGYRGPAEALTPRARAALDGDPPRLDEAGALLDRISLENLAAKPKSKVLRLRGELLEARGERAGAVDAYRKALELNPHVGVKGRMQALAKKLGG